MGDYDRVYLQVKWLYTWQKFTVLFGRDARVLLGIYYVIWLLEHTKQFLCRSSKMDTPPFDQVIMNDEPTAK